MRARSPATRWRYAAAAATSRNGPSRAWCATHLGSIWEGTSNIVALDVLRAINRENSLPALRRHVDQLLAEGVPCTDALAATQQDAIERSFAFAAMAAEGNRAELARQAATLLYHAVSIAALRREAREPAWKRARCWPTWCCGIAWPRATRIRRPRTKAPTAPPSCNTRCSTARPRRRRHSRRATTMETTMKRLLIRCCWPPPRSPPPRQRPPPTPTPRVRHAGRALPARRPDRRDGAPPGRKLRQPLNQNVIVENRAGAGGNIGSEYVAHAKPDGYTILFGTSGPLAINISLYKNQGYDPEKSFAPVIRIGHLPNILVVHPSVPRPTCRR